MDIDIEKEFKRNSILLSIFESQFYNQSVTSLLNSLKDKKICYVTMSKTADHMIKRFNLNNIKTDSIFFIDGVSCALNKCSTRENVISISSPYAFTELSIAINEILKTKEFDLLVFDSLSNLKVYARESISIKFTRDLITKIRAKQDKAVLTCLQNDAQSNLIMQSSMYVDKVLTFPAYYDELRKKNMTITGTVFALLIAASALLFTSNTNQITGFVTAAAISSHSEQIKLFPFLILGGAIAAAILLYKRMSPYIDSKIDKIEPKKIKNKAKLRNSYKNKLDRWLNKKNI